MVTRFRSNGRTGRNNGEWQQGFGFLTAISKTCLLPPEQETVTPCQKSVTPLKKLLPPAIVAKTCRRAKRKWDPQGSCFCLGVCGQWEAKPGGRRKHCFRSRAGLEVRPSLRAPQGDSPHLQIVVLFLLQFYKTGRHFFYSLYINELHKY